MAHYKKIHIKDSNPELWEKLNAIVQDFPPEISKSEYVTNVDELSIRKLSEQGTYLNEQSIIEGPINQASSVSLRIDEILEKYDSLKSFISDDYRTRKQNDVVLTINTKDYYLSFYKHEGVPFDRVPLHNLEHPAKIRNPLVLEAYTRRRVIFSLLQMCALIDVKMFNSNEHFKGTLLKDPQKINSNFNKATKIDPCIIQTKIGYEAIQSIELWDKKNIEGLAIALRPKGSRITSDHDVIKHTSKIQKILFILIAIEPRVTELKDRELMELIKNHNHYKGNYDPDTFRKLRKQIFSK